jgi:hypothetical protein
MAASRIGWGWNLAWAKIKHRAAIATAAAPVIALGAVVLAAVLGPAAAPAAAQAPETHVVRDIPVDATAENAAKAREVALAQGQQAALRQLLERLTPPAVHDRLPAPPASEVETMVLGLSVSDEKTSRVRYLARMTVRFMPDAVRALLEKNGLPYVDGPAPTLAVLAMWRPSPESLPVLWEDPNPWRRAWAALPRGGLQPIETPLGDLQDVLVTDAERLAEADPATLRPLAERYGAQGILVAEAVLRPGRDNGPPSLEVSGRTADKTYGATLQPQPGEPLAALLHRAATALRDQMAAAWSARNALPAGPASHITVLASLSGLTDWLAVRGALDEARGVEDWTLQALTRDRAQVALTVRGGTDLLAEALAAHGLTLTQDAGYWVIDRRPASPPAPTSAPTSAPAQAPRSTVTPAATPGAAGYRGTDWQTPAAPVSADGTPPPPG